MTEPVFINMFKERIVATKQEIAKAQELLCPKDNSEMKDLSNPNIGAAQCFKCGNVYFWRMDP